MYTHSPKPNRAPGIISAAICFFAAFALFVPFPVGDAVLMFMRGIGLWLFFGGYAIADRFVFTSFSYYLEENEDVPGQCDFTVVAVKYKKRRVVCRISVDQIIEIKEKKRGDKRPRGVKKYNYCPDLAGKNRYILHVEDDDEAFISFSPDETMVNIIKNIIKHK